MCCWWLCECVVGVCVNVLCLCECVVCVCVNVLLVFV